MMSDENHFDFYVAKKYARKYSRSREECVDFTLSLFEFKKIISRKTCFYTGVVMNKPIGESSVLDNDLTLDRVDNSKGYVSGNVVACTRAANNLKGIWENPKFEITVENARDIALKTISMLNKLDNIDSK